MTLELTKIISDAEQHTEDIDSLIVLISVLKQTIEDKDVFISSLISDIVFLRSQVANQDKLINRYQPLLAEENHVE